MDVKKLFLSIALICILITQLVFTAYSDENSREGKNSSDGFSSPTLKLERWAKITHEDHAFIWQSCKYSSNCGGEIFTCSLSIDKIKVSAGEWKHEPGISLGIPLPEGFRFDTHGNITLNGNTSVTVEPGVKVTCNMKKCQGNTLEVGTLYRKIIREVPCFEARYTPTQVTSTSPERNNQTSTHEIQSSKKYASLNYLLLPCKVFGECPIPLYSSKECPNCPQPNTSTSP